MSKTIAIIGAGASGMMCAITAMRRANELGKNVRILILERNPRAGKKLLVTGNGKCNLTNTNENIEAYHSNNIDFVQSVLAAFGVENIMQFFRQIGLTTVTANGTCVYPRSMQAASVLDVLRFEAQRLGIEFLCDFEANSIRKKGNSYEICSANTIRADKVVIACGSCVGGGSGSGLTLLKSLGHKIYTPYPALTALECNNSYIKTAQGMRANAAVTLTIDGNDIRTEYGEVLFCDYGVSGIAVMQLSGYVSKLVCSGKKSNIRLRLDLANEYNFDALLTLLYERRQTLSHLTLENLLCGFLNKRVAMMVVKSANIGVMSRIISTLTDDELKTLVRTLKSFDVNVTGTKGANAAQVMGGGASLADFDITTLESKKLHGIYACGEVLDVYGDCGGYNLTWAWASGAVCGKAVVESNQI